MVPLGDIPVPKLLAVRQNDEAASDPAQLADCGTVSARASKYSWLDERREFSGGF